MNKFKAISILTLIFVGCFFLNGLIGQIPNQSIYFKFFLKTLILFLYFYTSNIYLEPYKSNILPQLNKTIFNKFFFVYVLLLIVFYTTIPKINLNLPVKEIFTFIISAIFVSIVEEYFFRLIPFLIFFKSKKIIYYLLSIFLFTLLHYQANTNSLLIILILAIYFSILMQLTKDIKYPIFIHFIIDLFAFIDNSESSRMHLEYYLILLPLLFSIIIILKFIQKKEVEYI